MQNGCVTSILTTLMGAFEIEGWLWSFSPSTLGEVTSNVKSPPMLTTHGSSMSSSLGSPSLNSLSWRCKYVGFATMVAKPPWLDPYHVAQYWIIFPLVKLIHVRRITTWCLHKFPCNTYSNVQQKYLVKGKKTL